MRAGADRRRGGGVPDDDGQVARAGRGAGGRRRCQWRERRQWGWGRQSSAARAVRDSAPARSDRRPTRGPARPPTLTDARRRATCGPRASLPPLPCTCGRPPAAFPHPAGQCTQPSLPGDVVDSSPVGTVVVLRRPSQGRACIRSASRAVGRGPAPPSRPLTPSAHPVSGGGRGQREQDTRAAAGPPHERGWAPPNIRRCRAAPVPARPPGGGTRVASRAHALSARGMPVLHGRSDRRPVGEVGGGGKGGDDVAAAIIADPCPPPMNRHHGWRPAARNHGAHAVSRKGGRKTADTIEFEQREMSPSSRSTPRCPRNHRVCHVPYPPSPLR